MNNSNTPHINVEGKEIGEGFKSLLIGEISANHDRDLEYSLGLVELAAKAGWDCIKLQTYSANSLTVKSNHPSLQVDPIWGHRNLYELYESASMPFEFHKPLFDRARELGLLPFTSIYDPIDLDFVESLGCGIYKIASFELTYDDLLMEVAKTGKPIILSTGMANLAEIHHALDIIHKNCNSKVVLLHCCSAYPAPLKDVNLSAMTTLQNEFGCPIGYSDHTVGSIAAIAASAMGAVAIEKHYTSDVSRKGPDHRFSATFDDLCQIAEAVTAIPTMRGNGEKKPQEVERVSMLTGRRSAFAIKDLEAGHVITAADFRFVRPCAGIIATDKEKIIGKTLNKKVNVGMPITYADV